jgi:hypothetical protein
MINLYQKKMEWQPTKPMAFNLNEQHRPNPVSDKTSNVNISDSEATILLSGWRHWKHTKSSIITDDD